MPADLGPVAILQVLLKVYCVTMLLLVEGSLDKLSEWQFAFRPRRQCREIIFMLRNLTEKALEWKVPISFADGDLPKAYDNARHSVATKRLVERWFPRIVVAATLMETINSQCRIRMGSILTGPIRRTKIPMLRKFGRTETIQPHFGR